MLLVTGNVTLLFANFIMFKLVSFIERNFNFLGFDEVAPDVYLS